MLVQHMHSSTDEQLLKLFDASENTKFDELNCRGPSQKCNIIQLNMDILKKGIKAKWLKLHRAQSQSDSANLDQA